MLPKGLYRSVCLRKAGAKVQFKPGVTPESGYPGANYFDEGISRFAKQYALQLIAPLREQVSQEPG